MKEVKNDRKPLIFYYVIAMIILILLNLLLIPSVSRQKIRESTYGGFLKMLDEQEIDQVEVNTSDDTIYFTDKSGQEYRTGIMEDYKLVDRLYDAGI